jgi:hypothetical protein
VEKEKNTSYVQFGFGKTFEFFPAKSFTYCSLVGWLNSRPRFLFFLIIWAGGSLASWQSSAFSQWISVLVHIDHFLQNTSSRIDKPVADLTFGKTSLSS